MTFNEQVQADFDAILGFNEHSETVRYRVVGGVFCSIVAVVTTGSVDDSELIGVVAEHTEEPIIVQVSKSDVPVVTTHDDVVEFNDKEYSVKAIIEEDPGAFRLYCVK